jgi:hypothetical protein
MASGDTLFELFPIGSVPTTTVPATLDFLSDGSTVVGQIPVLDFAGATADEHAEWVVIVPSHYGDGGLTFEIQYAPAGTNTGAVQFEVRADKVVDDELLTSHNLQAQTATDITDTPNGTANDLHVTSTGAISHANAGSPAPGDYLRIRLSRDYDHAANADDAQVLSVYVTET